MPWRAGWIPASPGMKTDTVLRSPALITSSAETNTMIPISIRPRATPTRVEIEMPAIGQVPDDARAEQRQRHPQVFLLVAGELGDE